MIRVDVEEYCHHSCLDFTPSVIRTTRNLDDNNTWTDTVIQCEYHKRCANIERYLKQRAKEEAEAVG